MEREEKQHKENWIKNDVVRALVGLGDKVDRLAGYLEEHRHDPESGFPVINLHVPPEFPDRVPPHLLRSTLDALWGEDQETPDESVESETEQGPDTGQVDP